LAGIWQMLFGILGAERIIKCTPHPVLAGFVTGIGALVIIDQLGLLLTSPARSALLDHASHFLEGGVLARLLFALALAGFILYFGARTRPVTATVAGLGVGITVFYLMGAFFPALSLGSTIGPVSSKLSLGIHFAVITDPATREAFIAIIPALLITSLNLALVGALESLLAFRVAQNLADVPAQPARDVFGQGVGNFVAAIAGGLASAASSSQIAANYEAGGRSRLSPLTAAVVLLLISTLFSEVLAIIPVVVMWAILIAIGVLLFDRWTLRLVRDLLLRRAHIDVGRGLKNLTVAGVITGIVASGAVIGGTLAGIALSCLLFIVDMSRSIVRRRLRGDQVFSKRVRPAEDQELLRRTGARRAVLELQGVMFFGNADDLSREIKRLYAEVDFVILDLRGITDIDISAARILRHDLAKAAEQGKTLLLCNVQPAHLGILDAALDEAPVPQPIFDEVDAALEWMEERALHQGGRAAARTLSLEEIDLLRGLDAESQHLIEGFLTPSHYRASEVICKEGEVADRMWILTRGSVSVRLTSADHARSRRIASLASGTSVGEMSLIEGGLRTATVVADEDVEGFMLTKSAFERIMTEHPPIGIKLLASMLREMARRVRVTSEDLRAANG
ncbi:MAG TPA: SulP family inorganic anion transporter, partial [Stellaceae bacterium]|nr:SulP family inorganic anion transporter [Stellaceae bacterium]